MMKKMVQELEGKIKDMGLMIGEKKENDDLYIITIPHQEKGEFIVYTTKKAVEHDGESAFRMYQMKEHIPFDIVTEARIDAYLWHYESFCLMRDLPIAFNKPSSKEVFVNVYLDAVKKSNKRVDRYKYSICGISIEEIFRRMESAESF